MEGEQVIEKIVSDAQAEAEKIKAQARQKQAERKAKADEQLKEYAEQTKTLAAKAGEDAKNQVLAAARMQTAKDYLAEKAKLLDNVFARAQEKIKTLPDEQYRELIAKIMIDSVQSGDEEVIIDANEKRIDRSLIDKVNQQLSSKGKGNLKLSDERQDIAGGFILKKGKIKNNASFDVLLAGARDKLEIELVKQLFAD